MKKKKKTLDEIKIEVVESFLCLASTDKNIAERYGAQISEYYDLPIENKQNICNNVYKCFSKDGHLEIDCVCASIVYEVERFEDKISADRKALVDSIKRNVKRQPERPRINFRKAKDE